MAVKAGAINLAAQFEREQTPLMREAILGSLSAFIKSASFDAKRQYVSDSFNGIEQLCRWLKCSGAERDEKFGPNPKKLYLKLLQLLSDLVINDESIVDDGMSVRNQVKSDHELVKSLIERLSLVNSDAESGPEA